MPDLEQMLAEAQAGQKKKKFSRGLRPDHLTRGPAPTLPLIELMPETQGKPKVQNTPKELFNPKANNEPEVLFEPKDKIEPNVQINPKVFNEPKILKAPKVIFKPNAENKPQEKNASEVKPNEYTEGEFLQKPHQHASVQILQSHAPDLDQGFTRVPNQFLSTLYRGDLSKNETQVLGSILRLTIGFNRTVAPISLGVLKSMTGLQTSKIADALNRLISLGLITRKSGDINSPNLLGVNLNENSKIEFDSPSSRGSRGKATQGGEEPHVQNTPQVINAPEVEIIPKTLGANPTLDLRCKMDLQYRYNRKIDNLSLPKEFEMRLSLLTENQAEREKIGFQKLVTQFPEEGHEIVQALIFLSSTGKDLSGSPLRSPMGLLLTNYPQVRDYLRERSATAAGVATRKQEHVQQKAQEIAQEQLDAALYSERQEAFLKVFHSEEDQQRAIEQWTSGAPWIKDKHGTLARHFAINAWGSQQGDIPI